MNILSRNRPVSLVVGAAGFLGSHLVEELLGQKIQVVGVDNLSTGSRDNLTEASKNKNFEFIICDVTPASNLQLPRLDYGVFMITESQNNFRFRESFKAFLNYCKNFKPKIKVLLCSTIDLYDSGKNGCENLKFAESFLAKEALDNKINARIIRLSSVFGPRMHFRNPDPMIRLIKSAVNNKLNKESTPLEFTTRALYIKDAIKFLIKSLMHGVTAQKIYDGVAPSPIKVSEIKQVLLDPLWYEEKGFTPTSLPPWPTPNFNKTCKELSFKTQTNIVEALKETLAFFNSHKDKIPIDSPKEDERIEDEIEDKKETKIEEKKEPIKEKNQKKYSLIKSKIIIFAGLVIIFYALIFPLLQFGYLGWMAKTHFENSLNQLSLGDFDSAQKESKMARGDFQNLINSVERISFVQKIDYLKKPYQDTEQALVIIDKVFQANDRIINGAKSLSFGLFAVSGEKEGDSLKYFADAKTELDSANSKIGEVSADFQNGVLIDNSPVFLKNIYQDLENKKVAFEKITSLGKSLADLLPEVISVDKAKNYLIVLQDNRILRPGGGQLRAYAEVTFDHGKLLKIKTDSIENLDKQLLDKIEPPIELKTDLGETNWRLRDALYDLDFPTSAKKISWFFNKESGETVSGVIVIDLQAASKLLPTTDEINSKNLFSKISLEREGNQASVEVLKNLVERAFYLTKQNFVILAKNSEELLNQKHLLVYLAEPSAFSYLTANGWSGKINPNLTEKIGERNNFLAFSETNMSLGQDSLAIERSAFLQSKIDESGTVSHKLSINFSAKEALNGKYKNRFKIYISPKTKLLKASWGNAMIKDMSTFSDYGLAGFSMLLELDPGVEKQLVFEYQDTLPIKFADNQFQYKQIIFKQISQESLPFEYKITFPPENKVKTNLESLLGEVFLKTDLSKDREFKIILHK